MSTPPAPGPAPPTPLLVVPRRGRFAILVSLSFLVAPAVGFAADTSGPRLVAGLVAVVAFIIIYSAVTLSAGRPLGLLDEAPVVAGLATLVLLGAAIGVLGGTQMSGVWCFVAAAAGLRIDRKLAWPTLLVLAGIAAAFEAVGGDGTGGAVSLAIATLGVGMLTAGFRRLHTVNRQLGAARDEIGRLAVADERLRFARDLHDLLGHSLSVVALKSELANRLLPDQPEQAAEHVRDIEAVSRRALAEVRDAVAGYRRPLLADELAGARSTLRAAGIEVDADPPPPLDLPADAEAVLAWAVREGVTNVLRHADARRVRIRVAINPRDAEVELVDDGCGAVPAAPDGTGLAGLAERVARVRGRMEAAPAAGGAGFRLAISVPLGDAA